MMQEAHSGEASLCDLGGTNRVVGARCLPAALRVQARVALTETDELRLHAVGDAKIEMAAMGDFEEARRAQVLVIAMGMASVVPCASAGQAPADTSLTTVIFVRHAERNDKFLGSDPPLSAAGTARAKALAHVLGESRVSAIYVSEWARTRLTAEPLAKLVGDTLRVLRGQDFEAQARRIHDENRGGTAVVVGHSDTVPQLIKALTGEKVEFGHNRCDPLFVAFLYPGGSKLMRFAYGAASDSL